MGRHSSKDAADDGGHTPKHDQDIAPTKPYRTASGGTREGTTEQKEAAERIERD